MPATRDRTFRSTILAALLLTGLTGGVSASDQWTLQPVREHKLPPEILKEPGPIARNGLPDGRIAMSAGTDVSAAWYSSPTRRYGHAVLGDGIEAGTLHVRTANGKQLDFILPETQVFEDRTPRLVDLDADGTTEIITIRSSLRKGASVAVYGIDNDRLVERASTEFIGRPNRWLNIAAIARFKAGPERQIAFVRTPHIGGTVFFYWFRKGKLIKLAARDGFSNHVIGSPEMRLSAVADIDGDQIMELALPSKDRRHLRIIGLDGNNVIEHANVPIPGRIDKAIMAIGSGQSVEFTIGADDGAVHKIER